MPNRPQSRAPPSSHRPSVPTSQTHWTPLPHQQNDAYIARNRRAIGLAPQWEEIILHTAAGPAEIPTNDVQDMQEGGAPVGDGRDEDGDSGMSGTTCANSHSDNNDQSSTSDGEEDEKAPGSALFDTAIGSPNPETRRRDKDDDDICGIINNTMVKGSADDNLDDKGQRELVDRRKRSDAPSPEPEPAKTRKVRGGDEEFGVFVDCCVLT